MRFFPRLLTTAADVLVSANLIVSCPICAGSFRNSLVALHVEKCNGVAPASTGAAAWGKLMDGGGSGPSQAAGNECIPFEAFPSQPS